MGADLVQDFAHQRHLGDIVEREQFGAQAVIDVVGVIGNVVGDGCDLRLGAGVAPELEVLGLAVTKDGRRHATLAVAANRGAAVIGERAVVLDQPFECLPGEVEPVEGGVATLQLCHHSQRLRVVVEAAEGSEAPVERALASVAERRVAEVVAKRQRLRQILIEPKRAGQRSGDLGHFERMRQPGAEMIAFVKHEDLGLVRQPAKSGGVDDAVAVAAEIVAGRARQLRIQPAAAITGLRSVASAHDCRFDRHA